jgi:signal transduction histidine kinase
MGPAHREIATRRARELRQRLLAFEGSRANSRPFVSVATIVEEVVRLLRAGLPEEIGIESSCPPETPLIRADATQLMQALLNLGINAGHAMEGRPGTLDIHAAGITVTETLARSVPGLRSGRFVRIEVRDTGHGMDAETQLLAFEPFFTRKPPEKGAGLGLAVVRRIVQGHRGIMVLHSAPDIGSSFEMYLPCTA